MYKFVKSSRSQRFSEAASRPMGILLFRSDRGGMMKMLEEYVPVMTDSLRDYGDQYAQLSFSIYNNDFYGHSPSYAMLFAEDICRQAESAIGNCNVWYTVTRTATERLTHGALYYRLDFQFYIKRKPLRIVMSSSTTMNFTFITNSTGVNHIDFVTVT